VPDIKTTVCTLIVGQSGSGKSSTFRNLNPDRTVIINLENKVLPFRDFNKFKNINVTSYKMFSQVLAELKKSKDYDFVVVDSFTSLTELIYKYCDLTFSGYEVWGQYNKMIQDSLWSIKGLEQQVFVTAIPEYHEANFGESKGYAKVKGKEWKYSIEKEFAIVLWTKMLDDDDGIVTDYTLEYKPNKHNTAKSPHELLDGKVSNDAKFIAEKITEYYG